MAISNISLVLVFQLLLLFQFCNAEGDTNLLTELENELFVKHDNHTDRVTIYTESDFWGIPWSMTVSNCTDVPRLFYKKASSINTHDNCMILYTRQNCRGRHVLIAPGTSGHSHLSEVNFDNTLASLKPCHVDPQTSNSTNLKDTSHKRFQRNINILKTLMGQGQGTSSENESTNTRDNNESEDGSSSQPQEDDGALEMPSFLQNFNLQELLSRFTGGENDNSFMENTRWISDRFRREANDSTKQNEMSGSGNGVGKEYPPVPLQNVIY